MSKSYFQQDTFRHYIFIDLDCPWQQAGRFHKLLAVDLVGKRNAWQSILPGEGKDCAGSLPKYDPRPILRAEYPLHSKSCSFVVSRSRQTPEACPNLVFTKQKVNLILNETHFGTSQTRRNSSPCRDYVLIGDEADHVLRVGRSCVRIN